MSGLSGKLKMWVVIGKKREIGEDDEISVN